MSEQPTVVEGGFADLGLESPNVAMPTYGVPVGVHHAFIKDAKFVQNKSDKTKKNLLLEYEVDEPGNPAAGKSIQEYKPANASDSADVKGFLKERLFSLGVTFEEMPTLQVKTLIGMPVYITVGPQKNNPQYTQVFRVNKDNDGQFKEGADIQPPVHTVATDASSLGY